MTFEVLEKKENFFFEFKHYINFINNLPVLSLKEEKIFLLRLKNNNDALAIHYLIISHLRYVLKIARSFVPYGFLLADLLQEGTVGLLKSIKKYTITKNSRLISFSMYWIKAEIYKYIVQNLYNLKIELMVFNTYKKFFVNTDDKFYFEYCNNYNDICNFFNRDFYIKNNNFLFFNSFNHSEIMIIIKYLIFEILEKFDFKKKLLFFFRWFNDTSFIYTFEFIGFRLGLSEESVRQYEKKVLLKIKILLKFFF